MGPKQVTAQQWLALPRRAVLFVMRRCVRLVWNRHVKECDQDIIRRLKAEGRLVKAKTIVHSYPFCWRSETPLIYKVPIRTGDRSFSAPAHTWQCVAVHSQQRTSAVILPFDCIVP